VKACRIKRSMVYQKAWVQAHTVHYGKKQRKRGKRIRLATLMGFR
jgi:hypothetical protein